MDQQGEGERRFQQLADTAPILMWRADETMACNWVNGAWLGFTGRNLEQELGFGWVEALHPDDRDTCVDAYKQAFSRGKPFSLTYRLRRADGAFRWMLDNARPIMNEHGEIAGCFGSCTDVDDMVKANEALREAWRERAEAVAQRDHLLREVQHRVRNNLQLILSIIDMQARADPSSRTALGLVAGRVRSIAKAQSLLLDPTGKAQIDLAEYVPSLARNAPPGQRVAVVRPDHPLLMPLARAVPLGLMINEILSSMAGEDGAHQLRVAVHSGPSETSIEIEALDADADTTFCHEAESKLMQRLSAQAGAQVQRDERNRKVVLRIDPL
ncbi:MAG: sensor histidine kinase [Beijerinckiaceae bacterium]